MQVFQNAEHLFRLAVGISIDSTFECQRYLHGSDESPMAYMSTLVMYLWLVTSLILLLNMLIANMTKSFDDVHKRSADLYKFMFAHSVIIWHHQDPAPPLSPS